MTDGAKDVPVKTHISGYREINIPVVVTLQRTSAKDIPVKVTLQGDGVKDVPVAATLETYRVDYGLYGESIYETAPRETIFYAQGGTPDKSIATTDPYWFIKSGASETGKEGFMEIGFGQNDAHNQSDTNLTGFIRVQLDGTSGEGEVKIKPSLWFYPSAEPTTDQEGMIYYDSTAQEFKFYNGATWGSIGGGGGTVGGTGTAGTITKWATGGTSIEDSVITESGGNIAMSGDLAVNGGKITATPPSGTSALVVEAGDLDVHIWETLRAGAQNYGYYMKYVGTGSGDANYLELWSHNAEASNELLMRWHQTNQVTEVAGNLTVSSGYINSPTNLFIEPTGHVKLNPTTYVHLESAAANSMYFDCGSIFQFRDVDASAAVVAEIASTTGGLTLGVATQTTDPIELLKFRTERSWSFRKRSTTGTTRLALESDVDSKEFWIGHDNGTFYAAKFFIGSTQATCAVTLAHDVTIDGDLTVTGGQIGAGIAPFTTTALTSYDTNTTLIRGGYGKTLWYQDATLDGYLIRHSWSATYSDYIQIHAMAASAVGPTFWVCRAANYHLMLRDAADVELMTVTGTGDMTLAGDLDVDGGTIEVANSFEIEYNSTSDSLDFNYIG